MTTTCVICGKEFEPRKCGKPQKNCSKECQLESRRNTARVYWNNQLEKNCVVCGKKKKRRYFSRLGDTCLDCEGRDPFANRYIKTKECHKCKHIDNCNWLLEVSHAPLCFYGDDDPNVYALLPAVDRVRVAGIIGLRYYEKFKAVQGELC